MANMRVEGNLLRLLSHLDDFHSVGEHFHEIGGLHLVVRRAREIHQITDDLGDAMHLRLHQCQLVAGEFIGNGSLKNLDNRLEMDVRGLPTSCAIPAASVPMLSIFCECINCCSRAFCSVISRCEPRYPTTLPSASMMGEISSCVYNRLAVLATILDLAVPYLPRANHPPYSCPRTPQ